MDHRSPHRFQLYITINLHKVDFLLPQIGFKPLFLQCACSFMTEIKKSHIHLTKGLHHLRNSAGTAWCSQKMNMISHQHPRMKPAGSGSFKLINMTVFIVHSYCCLAGSRHRNMSTEHPLMVQKILSHLNTKNENVVELLPPQSRVPPQISLFEKKPFIIISNIQSLCAQQHEALVLNS
jgi:hypothetical protein